MNKAKIERIAREARAKAAQAGAKSATAQAKPATAQMKSGTANTIASDALQQQRETRGAVRLATETIDAIVGGFSRELRRAILELGPILARLAAADTIHSVERAATILERAVVEGRTAAEVVKELEVEG